MENYDSYLYRNTIYLLKSLLRHDAFTLQHSISVANISKAIALKLGIDSREVQLIHMGALLHDIGKIKIPQSILQKPGKLAKEEYEIIKEHPESGWNLVSRTQIGDSRIIQDAILQHHERLDGSGYPFGLGKQEISLTARIVAAADVFDAMTGVRPYKKALPITYAYGMLCEKANVHFDPEVVSALGVCLEHKAINCP